MTGLERAREVVKLTVVNETRSSGMRSWLNVGAKWLMLMPLRSPLGPAQNITDYVDRNMLTLCFESYRHRRPSSALRHFPTLQDSLAHFPLPCLRLKRVGRRKQERKARRFSKDRYVRRIVVCDSAEVLRNIPRRGRTAPLRW